MREITTEEMHVRTALLVEMLADRLVRLEKEVRALRALVTPLDPGTLPATGKGQDDG